MTWCGTCGSAVRVLSSTEGTQHYEPMSYDGHLEALRTRVAELEANHSACIVRIGVLNGALARAIQHISDSCSDHSIVDELDTIAEARWGPDFVSETNKTSGAVGDPNGPPVVPRRIEPTHPPPRSYEPAGRPVDPGEGVGHPTPRTSEACSCTWGEMGEIAAVSPRCATHAPRTPEASSWTITGEPPTEVLLEMLTKRLRPSSGPMSALEIVAADRDAWKARAESRPDKAWGECKHHPGAEASCAECARDLARSVARSANASPEHGRGRA